MRRLKQEMIETIKTMDTAYEEYLQVEKAKNVERVKVYA